MKAFFAGSFNPFTIGHDNIVRRALALIDGGVVIGIGYNCKKQTDSADIQQRIDAIKRVYAAEPRVEVIAYDCLTTDAARGCDADVLLRGVRSVADFEYERNLADINRQISCMETLIMVASPSLSVISSSMVRELAAYGKDISAYLP